MNIKATTKTESQIKNMLATPDKLCNIVSQWLACNQSFQKRCSADEICDKGHPEWEDLELILNERFTEPEIQALKDKVYWKQLRATAYQYMLQKITK